MCGIMAYIGKKEAYPILLNGLKKLEYRGYDSAGVALMNGSLSVLKKQGKVSALEAFALEKKTDGNIGLGHTRWATHGEPSDINSHPHKSHSGRYTIVHNGIIENHAGIKKMLQEHDYEFQSDTDTEVLVQLIDWYQTRYKISTLLAFSRALQDVEGSFAVVLFDLNTPYKLWAARRQSPLVLGIGEKECLVSSDVIPLAAYVEEVVYVEDDVVVEMNDGGQYKFYDLELHRIQQEVREVDQLAYEQELGNYNSYMHKEIEEQALAVERLLDTVQDFPSASDIHRIIVVACGTSLHSGMIAERIIEKYARINVEVEYASEFRYSDPILKSTDLVIGISQSGETADTIAALELAKEAGCSTYALVNVRNSSIARLVDKVTYLHAGPEIGVASTKAYTNQVASLCKLVISLLDDQGSELANTLSQELAKLPDLIKKTVKDCDNLDVMGRHLSQFKSAIYLGRGIMHPVALEGALKLKEISYIHAEGFAAGEMKHGPIALVDENTPIIALCNNDAHLPKTLSNIREVKARKGIIIIIKSKDADIPEDLADFTIETPACHEMLSPMLQNIPLQLIAYHTALALNLDVDKPRNLAKSVTVE